jgi:hypothetical protein
VGMAFSVFINSIFGFENFSVLGIFAFGKEDK